MTKMTIGQCQHAYRTMVDEKFQSLEDHAASRPTVLEPLHHSDSFLDSLQSPQADPQARADPFDDLESLGSSSASRSELLSDTDRTAVPRHKRFGAEIRALRQSRTRLYVTVAGVVVAWFLCVGAVAMIRTGGFYRNPFDNSPGYPMMPH